MFADIAHKKLLLILIACFCLVFVSFIFLNQQTPSFKVPTISKQEIKTLVNQEKTKDNPILIDLRTAWEIKKTGKIPGAIHINYFSFNFLKKLKTLDPSKRYIVYCWVGVRSKKAAQKMQSMGLNVQDYRLGMKDWLK